MKNIILLLLIVWICTATLNIYNSISETEAKIAAIKYYVKKSGLNRNYAKNPVTPAELNSLGGIGYEIGTFAIFGIYNYVINFSNEDSNIIMVIGSDGNVYAYYEIEIT